MSKSLIAEKFQKTAAKWLKLQGQVRKECIEYLTRVLKEHNNELDWTDSNFEYFVSCPYNGGGHPEYASNVFSTIYGVKLGENDKIYLNTEDEDEYEIEEVDTAYVYDLCDYIENVVFGEDEEEKE